MEEYNAKIISTFLGIEDHGIPSFMIHLEYDGCAQGFGGYDLRFYGIKPIVRILEVVEVKKWEDLKGKYVRIRKEGRWNGTIKEIGNIVENKWYNIEKEGK